MHKPRPACLINYEQLLAKLLNEGPPKVCHSCANYDEQTGVCKDFGLEPPDEFLSKKNACDNWQLDIPF